MNGNRDLGSHGFGSSAYLDADRIQSYMSPPTASLSASTAQDTGPVEPSNPVDETGLSLFNIERDGLPYIKWFMYYDFIVTKSEAYYQLQPGYLPTENYPTRVKSEKTMINGERLHRCGVPGCKAKLFTRHYGLERHFLTVHQRVTEGIYCDYAKCPNKNPVRKDHLRGHYREYHAEDIIKRGHLKRSKAKPSQRKSETVKDFLAARIDNLHLSWWRCSKCLNRVRVNPNGYTCYICKVDCEPERVNWRENAKKSFNDGRAAYSTNGFNYTFQPLDHH